MGNKVIVKMAKYKVYPISLSEEEYNAIKEIIDRYNSVSAIKIKSIHQFIKLAIENYMKELEAYMVKVGGIENAKKEKE